MKRTVAGNDDQTLANPGRENMPPVKHGFLLLLLAVVVAGSGAQAQAPAGLPASADSDTVRTNVWLTEALMAEIVSAAATVMPPAPAAVRLVALRDDPRNDLFQAMAAEVLGTAGYDLYVTDEDPARQGAVDYVFGFNVQKIQLSYPDVGRTLGIWRRWVAREMAVSVMVEISEESSGRLLISERIERRFGDRFDSSDFGEVDSDEYDFTTAETEESGWSSRVEEIVVLGTLVGLVAIYFANTGD